MAQSRAETSHAARDGSERRLGVFFPLAAFEQRIMADPDVLGMMYNGSLGRGDADQYSDIDIKLVVKDETLERPGLLEHYMSWLGELHFVMSFGLWGNGYAGPDWQSIDVGIIGERHVEPGSYYHGATIIKDTDGRLGAMVAASPPPTPEVTREGAQKVIEEAAHILGQITLYNMRGSYIQAMGQLTEQAFNLYGLLARLRGREPYQARYVELFLPPDEYALLHAAWPTGPDRDEIRRAAQALWDWAQYVWAEAEQVLGTPLGVVLDQDAMLAALERHYAWT